MKGELLATPKTTDEAIELIASVLEILIASTPGEAAGRLTDEGRKTLLDFLLWRGESQ